jgi:hypothetical protein
MDDFKCPDCGSRALVYPKVLEDDAPVTRVCSELKRRSQLAVACKIQRPPLKRMSAKGRNLHYAANTRQMNQQRDLDTRQGEPVGVA